MKQVSKKQLKECLKLLRDYGFKGELNKPAKIKVEWKNRHFTNVKFINANIYAVMDFIREH